MSYNGRRGPNISEFIANLNAIPTAQDLRYSNAENYDLDEELAMFTNTQFYEVDYPQDVDLQAPFEPSSHEAGGELKSLGFTQGTPSWVSLWVGSGPVYNGIAPLFCSCLFSFPVRTLASLNDKSFTTSLSQPPCYPSTRTLP